MNGYEKLKKEILSDCNSHKSCGCFNENGCDKPSAIRGNKSCFHKYCDQFKWIINRAKHYEEKLGIPWQKILDSWEEDRNYWYMNYYQECNQPQISTNTVRVFDSVDDLWKSIEKKEFRCPSCGAISTDPYKCNSGVIKNNKKCDWKVYGLFSDLGKGVFVYCKNNCKGERIFMPIEWENKKQNLD